MIIIGEKLNSSIPSALDLMNEGNEKKITDMIKLQNDSGADYIDINTALCENELEMMKRVALLTTSTCNCGVVIDTPEVRVADACLELLSGRELIINSVTLDKQYD